MPTLPEGEKGTRREILAERNRRVLEEGGEYAVVEGVCRSRDSGSHPLGAAILTDDLSMLPRTPAIIVSDTGAKRSSENFTLNSVHARKAKSLDDLIIDVLKSAEWNATCLEMDQDRFARKGTGCFVRPARVLFC
jgi:hypothetical protein